MAEENIVKIFKFLRENVATYEKQFQSYIKDLVRELRGKCSIVLFGSRARGDNVESSDFDLAIIIKDDMNALEFLEKAAKLNKTGVPVDLVVLKEEDLEKGTIRKMLEGCKIIYDGLKIANKIMHQDGLYEGH